MTAADIPLADQIAEVRDIINLVGQMGRHSDRPPSVVRRLKILQAVKDTLESLDELRKEHGR